MTYFFFSKNPYIMRKYESTVEWKRSRSNYNYLWYLSLEYQKGLYK